jgi:DNA-binding MarR family transcriptional regulator
MPLARADLSLVHLLHLASMKADRFFEETTGSDLTPRQFELLSAVARTPGLSQTDIVEQTGIDRSTTALLADKLEQRGLIERTRDRQDRRAVQVTLTRAGEKLLRRIAVKAAQTDRALVAKLTDGSGSLLCSLLSELSV